MVKTLRLMFGMIAAGSALMGSLTLPGCNGSDKKKPAGQIKLAPRYASLAPKPVPAFLKDSILERCDLGNTQPYDVSSFGLVANLQGTGDCFAGTPVREFIRRDMIKRGLGSRLNGTQNIQPEDILKDPRWAIVRVDGLIPPGAHKHQRFDLYLNALDGNNTSSLAHGDLYQTDLKQNGANLQRPNYTIDVPGTGSGPVFVNPAYATATDLTPTEVRASLRQGIVLNGGVSTIDRPIMLRLRQPQLSLSRAIEYRLDQLFQDTSAASAKDEAMIATYVPEKFGADWQHFTQLVTHTFLNGSPDFCALKARQLAAEAAKPDAPLLDISYCLEALGPTAIPFYAPLLSSDRPEIAFAAARAAVFNGDSTAEQVLMEIAEKNDNPFQVNAVETLAKRPNSPVINQVLRRLLDSDKTLVRLEAYRALAENEDGSIISREIGDQKFWLDIVPCKGPPLIYATRTGVPRIAVLGNHPRVSLPVMFTAMQNKFTLTSNERQLLDVFYRGTDVPAPVSMISSTDVTELIGRLGGEGAPGDPRFHFDYCTIVAILQKMSDQKVFNTQTDGRRVTLAFALQDAPHLEQAIEEAPEIAQEPKSLDERITDQADSKLGMNTVK